MFIDDEKSDRDHRRRDRRAVLYITVAALSACVLMIVGLMNAARAESFHHRRTILEGAIGETPLLLDLGPADAARRTDLRALLTISSADVVFDPTTTASTQATDRDDGSIDRRLAAGIALATLIMVAGVSQIVGRNVGGGDAPAAPWDSEA